MEERDYEAEARKDGWVPADEWQGDPEQHKTAEQFVRDGEKIAGILKSKVERLETRVNELLDSNEKFVDFTKKAQERDRKEKETLITELEDLRKKAVDEGDGEAFTHADRRLTELRAEPEPGNEINEVGMRWLENNPWYAKDERMQAYADKISDRLRDQGYMDQSEAYFSELTTRVKEAYPDEFENKNRSRPNSVESGHEASNSQARTWANLPEDAKAAFKQFQRDMPGLTEEDFVSQYDWD
jgi:hypothetical protein